jgi:undecaprenyl-diphosphatase
MEMAAVLNLPPPESPDKPGPTPASAGLAMSVSLVVIVLGLLLFGWIADQVFFRHQLEFDNTVRAAIHAVASPSLTRFMQALTFLGSPAFVSVAYVACVGIFLYVRWKRAVGWLTLSLLGGTVLDFTLKLAFHRARPVAFFGMSPASFSFPSGHAAGAICFFGVLAGLIASRLRNFPARVAVWAIAVTLVAGIGISRVYLGVHYPTDVLAGWTAGLVWAVICWLVARYLQHQGAVETDKPTPQDSALRTKHQD